MVAQRTSIGLDVHARSIVACAIDERTGELTRQRFSNDPAAVLDWALRLPGPQRACYEAGPTGFGLARLLNAAGVECVVAAPSKLQRPAGDRVKTDTRDAEYLARLLRLDEVTAVRIPTIEQETARDLVRVRDDVRLDLASARHRLSKLLLRHGFVYDKPTAWGYDHDLWLRQRRAEMNSTVVFDACFEAVKQAEARKKHLEDEIDMAAFSGEFASVVRRLGCLRGISTLTGFGLAVEIGDWDRFTGATIGAFIGLVPSEYSSGGSRSQGPITKTGNGHARRLLVEAAWHHKKTYNPGSKTLQARWDAAPRLAALRGQDGNRRLHRKWQTFVARKKRPTVANTAIARELAGWCWSLAVMTD